jgi:hypothetical protein
MAKDPKARYPSCAAFAKAAMDAVRNRPTKPIDAAETQRNASLQFDTMPSLSGAPPSRSRSTLVIGLAAGAVLAGVAAIAAYWALSDKKDELNQPIPVATNNAKPESTNKADPTPPPPPSSKAEPTQPPKIESKPASPTESKPKEEPRAEPKPEPEPPAKPKSQPKANPRTTPKSPRRPTINDVPGQIHFINVLGGVKAFAVTPENDTAAISTSSGLIRTYDLSTGSSLRSIPAHRNGATALAFMPGSRVLVSGAPDGTIRAHDLETSRDAPMIGGHTRPVTCIAVSREIAVSGGEDGARAWNMANGRPLWVSSARDNRVSAVVFNAHGSQVYVVTNGVISARNPRGGGESRRFGSNVRSLAISPDGHSLAAGGSNGKVIVFDPRTGQGKELGAHSGDVNAVAFSPNGKLVLSGGEDKIVRLWDVAEMKEIGRFEGHADEITGIAFANDRIGVSASNDGTVRTIDLEQITKEEK